MADLLDVHVADAKDDLVEDLLGLFFWEPMHAALSEITEKVSTTGEASDNVGVSLMLEMLHEVHMVLAGLAAVHGVGF